MSRVLCGALIATIVLHASSAGVAGGAAATSASEGPEAAPEGRPAFLPGTDSGGAGAAFPETPEESHLRPLFIEDAECRPVLGCEACVASPGDRCYRNCYWWPC